MTCILQRLRAAVRQGTIYNRSAPAVAVRSLLDRRQARSWRSSGPNDNPPAGVKHAVIREYRTQLGPRVLVETGTFLGDTIYALRHDFDRIISIELDPELAARARNRFARYPNVQIRPGNSAEQLPLVLDELHEPALFWLDAHWSGGITARADKETPILEEISTILEHTVSGHVVLIDDARLLGKRQDYPTLEVLCQHVAALKPDWVCEMADGIVRVHARRSGTDPSQ